MIAETKACDQIEAQSNIVFVSLSLIVSDVWKTRKENRSSDIESLADSINKIGLQQYPSARLVDGKYELIYGHRRLEAFKLLVMRGFVEYSKIPLVIVEANDETCAVMAFEENDKRKELSVIEKALFLKRCEDMGWTQDKMGEMLSIDRSTVANYLRLLQLPNKTQKSIHDGAVSVRSGLAILAWEKLDESKKSKLDPRLKRKINTAIKSIDDGNANDIDIRYLITRAINKAETRQENHEYPLFDLISELNPTYDKKNILDAAEATCKKCELFEDKGKYCHGCQAIDLVKNLLKTRT